MNAPSNHPLIYGIYTVVAFLTNLVLFMLLQQVVPSVAQLHTQYSQQLPGIAQVFHNYDISIAVFIAALLVGQVIGIVIKRSYLFHLSMAASILSALFLLLTLFSATLLPALRLIDIMQTAFIQ